MSGLTPDQEWLSQYCGAQDRIVREMLGLLIGLGEASGAWKREHSDAGLEMLAQRLQAAAESSADEPTRRIVLSGFSQYAREWRERSRTLATAPAKPRGPLQ